MIKNKRELVKKFMNKEVLLGILKTGILFGVAITAPGVLKVFKDFEEKDPWFEYYPSSINRTMNKLYWQGMVNISMEEGKDVVKITKKGKVEVLKYDLSRLHIKTQTKWDGKWRLVVFDISEKYKKTREVVRTKLQEMGFFKFQESVFIYPFPCEKEMSFMREILHIPHSLKLIRADRIENDLELKKIFNLNI